MTQQKAQAKDNSGYLFPNKNKSNEKQPDYRGKLTKDGKEWLVSGWKKMKDGDEMISISLTDPDSIPQRPGAAGGYQAPAQKPAGAASPFTAPQAPQQSPQGGGCSDLDDIEGLFDGFQ